MSSITLACATELEEGARELRKHQSVRPFPLEVAKKGSTVF